MTNQKRIKMEIRIMGKIAEGKRLTEKEFSHCWNKRFLKELLEKFNCDCFDCLKIENEWYINWTGEDTDDLMEGKFSNYQEFTELSFA